MPTTDGSHEKTLAALGVTQPEQLAPLFAEIRARFDAESAAVRDEATFKQFRDAWLGRKSGVLAGITDNWLKPATPALKRAVGAGLNELRSHVDPQIEARRAAPRKASIVLDFATSWPANRLGRLIRIHRYLRGFG